MDPTFESVLRRHLTYLTAAAPLLADTPLKDLGLDSLQAVELVFDLEDELGITLPDEAMTAATFTTAGSLWAALASVDERASAGTS